MGNHRRCSRHPCKICPKTKESTRYERSSRDKRSYIKGKSPKVLHVTTASSKPMSIVPNSLADPASFAFLSREAGVVHHPQWYKTFATRTSKPLLPSTGPESSSPYFIFHLTSIETGCPSFLYVVLFQTQTISFVKILPSFVPYNSNCGSFLCLLCLHSHAISSILIASLPTHISAKMHSSPFPLLHHHEASTIPNISLKTPTL